MDRFCGQRKLSVRTVQRQSGRGLFAGCLLYTSTKVVGLPVGPICNPGMDAIEAAIHPADTNYYDFVSDDAGTYYFAATLEEHEANIRKANQVNEQLKSEAAVEETGE